jgi:hypothetical protein
MLKWSVETRGFEYVCRKCLFVFFVSNSSDSTHTVRMPLDPDRALHFEYERSRRSRTTVLFRCLHCVGDVFQPPLASHSS